MLKFIPSHQDRSLERTSFAGARVDDDAGSGDRGKDDYEGNAVMRRCQNNYENNAGWLRGESPRLPLRW